MERGWEIKRERNRGIRKIVRLRERERERERERKRKIEKERVIEMIERGMKKGDKDEKSVDRERGGKKLREF